MLTRFFGLVLFLAAAASAQQARVLIVTDMEGVGGVNDPSEQTLPGQRRYEETRRLLTAEVNAAVEGARAGGAGDVVIWDGHDGSRSLAVDEVRGASLIQGKPTPADYYLSDRLYDGILFVGQHAMAGAKNGVLAHTQSFAVESITLNGIKVGELGQMAAIAGYFHIPVVMLSGDQAACDEMRELVAKAEVAPVKRLAGKASTLSLPHAEACDLIRGAAMRAVRRVREFSPWRIEGPVEMKITYKDPAKPPQVYRGANMLEAYQAWLGK